MFLPLKQTEEAASRSVAYYWGMGDCSRLHQNPFKGHIQLHPILWTKEGEKQKYYQMPYVEVVLVSKEDMGQPEEAYKMSEFPDEEASIVPLVPETFRIAMSLLDYTQIENLTTVDICREESLESVNFCEEQYILYQNCKPRTLHAPLTITLNHKVRLLCMYESDVCHQMGMLSCTKVTTQRAHQRHCFPSLGFTTSTRVLSVVNILNVAFYTRVKKVFM